MNLSNKTISLTTKDNNNLHIKSTGYSYCYYLLQLIKNKIKYDNYFIKNTPIFDEYSHTNNHELNVVARDELGNWVTLPISNFLNDPENPLEGIEYIHRISGVKIYSRAIIGGGINDEVIAGLYQGVYAEKEGLDTLLSELDNHYNIFVTLEVVDEIDGDCIIVVEYTIITLADFTPYLPELLDMDKLGELTMENFNKETSVNGKPTIN